MKFGNLPKTPVFQDYVFAFEYNDEFATKANQIMGAGGWVHLIVAS